MDELLKEIGKLSISEGFTSMEASEALGYKRSWTTELLARLVHKGVVVYVGRRERLRIDGTTYWAPVYRIKEKP
jgi:DNA-binding IclR family transcriptional regulator